MGRLRGFGGEDIGGMERGMGGGFGEELREVEVKRRWMECSC